MGKLGWNGELQAVIVPVPGHRLRRLLHAPVHREAVPGRADRGRPGRRRSTLRIYGSVVLPGAAAGRRRCSACSRSCRPGTTSSGRSSTLTPDNPTVQVSLCDAGLRATSPDYSLVLAGTAAGDAAAARHVLRRRSPDHRRHHGRCGQGMTATAGRTGSTRRGRLPGRLPLGRRHGGLPDRGRRRRGRPRPVDLGHLRHTPGRVARRRHRRRRRATTTTATARTSP